MLWEISFQIHRQHLERENESVHEGIVTVPVLLSELFVIMHDESSLTHNVVDESNVKQTWRSRVILLQYLLNFFGLIDVIVACIVLSSHSKCNLCRAALM